MNSEEKFLYEGAQKLKSMLESGRLVFTENVDIEESLFNCKVDKNGIPILSTFDQKIRTVISCISYYDKRTKLKNSISLLEIQSLYFNLIESNIRDIYKYMVKNKLDADMCAKHIAIQQRNNQNFIESIYYFLGAVLQFWESYSEIAYIHTQDLTGYKGVYGGSLSPNIDNNIAKAFGWYYDSIILPCPIIRSELLITNSNNFNAIYYAIKGALNIYKYKECAIKLQKNPLVIVLPDKKYMNFSNNDFLKELMHINILNHANKVFEKEFQNIDNLTEFGDSLVTLDTTIKAVKQENLAVLDVEDNCSLKESIKSRMENKANNISIKPGRLIVDNIIGRISSATELTVKSLVISGSPLIDAPTSWEYFKLYLQNDYKYKYKNEYKENIYITNSLNKISNTPLNWIRNIPVEKLVEIRGLSELQELRNIIIEGLYKFEENDLLDDTKLLTHITDNLEQAFNNYNNTIFELSNKMKLIIKNKAIPIIIKGAIDIYSIFKSSYWLSGAELVLEQFFDIPKYKEIRGTIKDIRNISQEKKQLKNSSIGMFAKYQNIE